ncbi:D-alanine--D-alanine ligase family protein [Tundrisphaera sp. TA3]|uniref:D-alanine--D-alanine ligase family protein n=1 Tax=Tundrisphaera sp. TA3 TaxID=3435775 RepID=UPI003EB8034D
MKVGIAFDLAPASGPPSDGPDDRFEEFDQPETVHAIADVIRGEGHEVVLLGDGRSFLEKVLADPPDFVWNIAEGEGVGRCREARVPAALEMLGIPYSGSDPLTLAACLDKGTTRQMLDGWPLSVPMPRGCSLSPIAYDPDDHDRFIDGIYLIFDPLMLDKPVDLSRTPLILKPAFEGSSKGIRGRALAESEAELIDIWQRLVRDYDQPLIVEEFIAGDEVTVGVCGNPGPDGTSSVEVLGVMRVVPNRPDPRFVYSLDVKRDWRRRVTYETPARFDPEIIRELEQSACGAYAALGCRDFARIDFRVTPGGDVFFIEANPLPGLAPVTSDLVILAEGYGLSHADLIRKLFRIALTRVGLS